MTAPLPHSPYDRAARAVSEVRAYCETLERDLRGARDQIRGDPKGG